MSVCEPAGVQVLVYHGRGGAMGRGGRRWGLVRAMPPGSVRGQLRVTEQGESINDRYGLRPIAYRTFEQALHSLALTTAGVEGQDRPRESWPAALSHMAEASRIAYRALVHDDPAFIDYFQAVTPVDVIERAQIGSRPLSHPGGHGVEALRAIPWILSWSQSRHMLPGWYGAGAGLAAIVERHGAAITAEMYRGWAFFESLVDDIEMALARADIGIASFYDQLARPEHRPLCAVDPARVRAHLQPGAGRQGLCRIARLRTHVAALDPAAQPVRRSDPPYPGRPAATMARGRPAGAW